MEIKNFCWDHFIYYNYVPLGLIDTNSGRKKNIEQSNLILKMGNRLKNQNVNYSEEELKKNFLKKINGLIFVGLLKNDRISFKIHNLEIYEDILFGFKELVYLLKSRGIDCKFNKINFYNFEFKVEKNILKIKLSVKENKTRKFIHLNHQANYIFVNSTNYKTIIKDLASLIQVDLQEEELKNVFHPRHLLDDYIIKNQFILNKKCKKTENKNEIDIIKLENFIKQNFTTIPDWYKKYIKTDLERNGLKMYSISSIKKKEQSIVLNENKINNIKEITKQIKSNILNNYNQWDITFEQPIFNKMTLNFGNSKKITLEFKWDQWIWNANNFEIKLMINNKKMNNTPAKLTKNNIKGFIDEILNYIDLNIKSTNRLNKINKKDIKKIIKEVYKRMGIGKKWRRFALLYPFLEILKIYFQGLNLEYDEIQISKIIKNKNPYKKFIIDIKNHEQWSEEFKDIILESLQESYLICSNGKLGKYVEKELLFNIFRKILDYHGLGETDIDLLFSKLIKLRQGHMTIPAGQTASNPKVILQKKLIYE